ncbi:hypothetical protein ABZ177_00435 [Streptomyces sp. NPDC006284]
METALAAAQDASRSRMDTPASADDCGLGRACGSVSDMDAS